MGTYPVAHFSQKENPKLSLLKKRHKDVSEPIRPEITSQNADSVKYDHTKDRRLRELGMNIIVFFLMLTSSGYGAKYLFDQWVGYEGASDELTEGNSMTKVEKVKESLYKSEDHIEVEFQNATRLRP